MAARLYQSTINPLTGEQLAEPLAPSPARARPAPRRYNELRHPPRHPFLGPDFSAPTRRDSQRPGSAPCATVMEAPQAASTGIPSAPDSAVAATSSSSQSGHAPAFICAAAAAAAAAAPQPPRACDTAQLRVAIRAQHYHHPRNPIKDQMAPCDPVRPSVLCACPPQLLP
jgi:hypothetical protein